MFRMRVVRVWPALPSDESCIQGAGALTRSKAQGRLAILNFLLKWDELKGAWASHPSSACRDEMKGFELRSNDGRDAHPTGIESH